MCAYSVPWFGAAMMLALVASLLEEARYKCERLTAQTLTETEIVQIRNRIFKGYRTRILIPSALALLSVATGIVILLMVRMPGAPMPAKPGSDLVPQPAPSHP